MRNLQKQKENRIALASAQQRIASDPKYSVWVEASAGTGKTKVLSDRVLRLLLDGVKPNRILCLTYTKAAAVEMNNRIADRLSKWAVISDDELIAEIEKLLGKKTDKKASEKLLAKGRCLFAELLDAPGGIKIQTLHSFCQDILKRFPLEAKISPYFEVMDDRSAKEAIDVIKKEILNDDLNENVAEALNFFTQNLSEYSFPDVMAMITDNRNLLVEKLKKQTTFDELLVKTAGYLGIDVSDTKETIKKEFWKNAELQDLKLIIDALNSGTATTVKKAYDLGRAIENSDFEKCERIFLKKDGEPVGSLLVTKSRDLYPNADVAVVRITKLVKDTVAKQKALDLFCSTKAVLIIAEELIRRYEKYKEDCSKADYNDLIVLTKNLLESPKVSEWILYKLDGGIDNILIDEAQDTSKEQWAIVKALTKEFFSGEGLHEKQPTVFVVGDRKQSIYSFQGASPQEFENMHDYFADKAANFKDVSMEVSFRSTAAVLDVVNKVFSKDDAKKGVVKEGQNITHVPSRIGDGGRVELWELTEPDEDDESNNVWRPPVEKITTMSSSVKLAKKIAENIKRKVETRELLKSKNRPLKYSDFLILVQRRNGFVEELVRECKNLGVNIGGIDKINVLEQIAVQDLIALAKFVLLPDDDLNLACLLKSPIIGLDDNHLLDICLDRNELSVWQSMKIKNAYKKETDLLEQFVDKAKNLRPYEFFALALNKMQKRKNFVARLGVECEDAIDEFMNLTLAFEREHIPTLQTFVKWMEEGDVEIKREQEQKDNDAVRVMTVHGSKGLQAPVVILPDTIRMKTASKAGRLLEDDDFILYPLNKDYYEKNCERILEKEKQDSLEEYNRLLYVALTRAEECLCICGYKGKNNPNEKSWYCLCKDAFSEMAKRGELDCLVYDVEQEIEPESENFDDKTEKNTILPNWIYKYPEFETELMKPLRPSHQDEAMDAVMSPLKSCDNNRLFERGKIIHKLLQFLPMTEKIKRTDLAKDFLEKHAKNFDETERHKILNEVIGLLNDDRFVSLFGEDSVAEVALMGQVGDRIVCGQVDRLVVDEDKVMIVDYKTNRPPAKKIEDAPSAYVKQMKAYKMVVEKIYENRKVETYILWTNTATMMQIV